MIAAAIGFAGCIFGFYGHRLICAVEDKAVVLQVENFTTENFNIKSLRAGAINTDHLNVDAAVHGTLIYKEGKP